MTSTKDPAESARLALEYLAAGLSEVEITINRRAAAGLPQSLALDDIAGAVAGAVQELREFLD